MSRRARDWAWARYGLTPAQRLVLLALAEHADDHGESCFPSLGLLERMTELSRRGITKALNGLDGALIERDRGGPRRATRYRLLLCARSGDERASEGREPSALARTREPSALGNPVPETREHSSPGRELSTPSVGNPVPPNRHKNRHRTVNEPLSYSDDARTRTSTVDGGGKATRIPEQWRPGERVFDWAAKHAMKRAWVEAQVDEFVVYWSDTGERRKSWDATFIKRLQTLQANAAKGQDHEPQQRLADKDYGNEATPLDQIPWLRTKAHG